MIANSSNQYNNHTPSNRHNSTPRNLIKNLLNISTLNVRGLNDIAKVAALAEDLKNEHSILCCSETKISRIKPLPRKSRNQVIIASRPSESSKNGTCIIVGKGLTNHIFDTTTENEY